jgi:class 3 adenylate cyclase/tetratricopeptide (TPR) repeat protein
MRCQNCGIENATGSRFCNRCGTPLNTRCPKCRSENTPDARFCSQCGVAIEAATPIRAAEPREGLKGERRHLTVLFCDLVNSTNIAAQLDPEEWCEIIADYHRAVAQAIERFGGYVAQYQGDGVMAYFGYPEAHDNDAERAARAGLAILDAISKLSQQPARSELFARVGIDSGAVVVAASASKDADVFGDTPNIAARVQTAADPGMVLVTQDTHRLVSGLFVVEDRGAQMLKGVERPIQLYRVIQSSGVRGRLEAAAATHALTPFVGREDELRLLMNRWERAVEGEGQAALIIGEAGIGKSRLLQRFHEELADTPHTWLEAAAAPFFQNTPFYPVSDLLNQLVTRRGDESGEEQLTQLETSLVRAGLRPVETIPLIAPLLNLPLPAKYPPLALSAEQQQRRLAATLVDWVLGAARVQPLVIATEDLHWADPSTLDLIRLFVEQVAPARLLLLYTARPEFRVQWPPTAHHTQITLNRLSARNARTMVEEVAAHNALSKETITVVVERTGGVPLFVEELTRAVIESGNAQLPGREIPVTLHDSLMARLDRLGSAKEIYQVGAVIGSEFSYELLRAVHPVAEEHLQRALRNLADAELLYVRGIVPDATYLFKHALIRDEAYEALLKSRRKELHRLVARMIGEKFPALKEAHPEVLARHWTEAGETEQAISEWSQAGKAAEARAAFQEALESYQQAVALLNLLPESAERDLRELELKQSIFLMIQITKGWAAPLKIDVVERLTVLAEKTGKLTQLLHSAVFRGLTAFTSGDLSTAGALADEALELALSEANPTILGFQRPFESFPGLGGVYLLQVMVRYWRSDLTGAEQHFTTGLKYFDNPGFRGAAAVLAFAYGSISAWTLGRADLARRRLAQQLSALDLNNTHDLAVSDLHAAGSHVLMGEYDQAEALAAQALELSEKNQFPNEAAISRCTLGHAQAQLGRATEGISRIRQGISGLLEVGYRLGIAHFTTYLAQAQERAGFLVDARETIEKALREDFDKPVFRPEALRIRGELQFKQGQIELAEVDFREALALATNMGAKAWELRVTMSLARLLAKQGRRDEARAMLAEIYAWFTEGFDTADLKDGKALLEELGGTGNGRVHEEVTQPEA